MKQKLCSTVLTLLCPILAYSQGSTGYKSLHPSGSINHLTPAESSSSLASARNIYHQDNGSTFRSVDILKLDYKYDPVWTVSYESPDVGKMSPILVLNDDNYAGMTNGVAGVCVVKLEPDGSTEFERNYGFQAGYMQTFAFSKATGDDPGFLMGGGECAYHNFLIKCDEDGSVEWAKQYLVAGYSGVKTLMQILPVTDGYITASAIGNSDILLMRIDDQGALVWSKVVKHDSFQLRPRKMIERSNGKFVLLSNSDAENVNDIFIQFDANGNNFDFAECTSSEEIILFDFYEGESSKLYVSGQRALYPNPPFSKQYNLYLRINGDFSLSWAKWAESSTTANASFFATRRTPDNRMAMGGFANGTGTGGPMIGVVEESDGLGMCESSNATVSMTEPDGMEVEESTVTALDIIVDEEEISLTQHTPDLTPADVCWEQGDEQPDDDEEENPDDWPQGSSTPSLTSMHISPNPTQGLCTLQFGNNHAQKTVTVHDLQGRHIFTATSITEGQFELDLYDQPRGMYIIQTEANGMLTRSRLVKH